jgi:hypothetical protein
MAKWQEQEDGSVRNFSIISLAQRLVRKRVRRLLFIPQEVKRRHLDECQVLEQELESKSQEEGRPT